MRIFYKEKLNALEQWLSQQIGTPIQLTHYNRAAGPCPTCPSKNG